MRALIILGSWPFVWVIQLSCPDRIRRCALGTQQGRNILARIVQRRVCVMEH